jgi:hypothetical protein
MDAQEQLFGLIEAAEAQQKAAAATIAAMAQERRELLATVEAIRNAAGILPRGLQEAAGRAVRDSLDQGMKSANRAAQRAVSELSEATDQLRQAGTWVSFKTAAAVGLAGALTICAVYGMGRYMVASTLTDIEELQAQKAELQANVDNLARYGSRAKLTKCGGRLCIEASSNQGEGYENWNSPWKARNGRNLVILRGY